MNGREVLERIRASDPAVPVLVMTGFASVEDAMGAMWAGATDYVRKPLKADEVAGALERALASRGQGPAGPATVRSLAPAAPPSPREPPPADPASWLRAASAARGLPSSAGEEVDLTLEEAVRRFERLFVDELLRRARGNVARAARAAGISRPNLHRKMRSLGIDAAPYRRGAAP